MAQNSCGGCTSQQQEMAKTRSIQDGEIIDWKMTPKSIIQSL